MEKDVYRMDTRSYNPRRYGTPYIGVCDSDGKVVRWGTWIGEKGEKGELTIRDLSYGDVIIEGQKDYRGGNGRPKYGVVNASFDVIHYDTKIDAIKAHRKIMEEKENNLKEE